MTGEKLHDNNLQPNPNMPNPPTPYHPMQANMTCIPTNNFVQGTTYSLQIPSSMFLNNTSDAIQQIQFSDPTFHIFRSQNKSQNAKNDST